MEGTYIIFIKSKIPQLVIINSFRLSSSNCKYFLLHGLLDFVWLKCVDKEVGERMVGDSLCSGGNMEEMNLLGRAGNGGQVRSRRGSVLREQFQGMCCVLPLQSCLTL